MARKSKDAPRKITAVRKTAVKSSAKLEMWGAKANVVGTYHGTINGWSEEDGEYYYFKGSVSNCVVAQEGIEMSFVAHGFTYLCNLSRINGATNGFDGGYERGSDSGTIRGRIIPDLKGWLFVGDIEIEQKYRFYAELW